MNYFSYFSEIEELFVRRRGRNLLLSPLDWALIEAWKERGVPLHVVLRGIETVFDAIDAQPAPRKKAVKSLMYCREAVETEFAAWQETQVGTQELGIRNQDSRTEDQKPKTKDQNSHFASDDVFRHLRAVKNQLRENRGGLNGSWQTFSSKIMARLENAETNFASDGDAENLEIVLSDLDSEIDRMLPKIIAPERQSSVERETAAQLRAYKKQMTADAFAQTFHTLLVKNLRETASLPRFSLFYL